MSGYKNLVVWQKSIDLVGIIYDLTKAFPREELYGLMSQIRRSAVSIPSNLAEGYGRSGSQEYAHFIAIAIGSATELETLLLIAKNLSYLKVEDYSELNNKVEEILRMLQKLRQSIRTKIKAA